MLKYLPELLKEGIISQEVADNISNYYNSKKGQNQNKVMLIFGILGSLLIGLGIILIVAYNWDDYPHNTRLVFSFIPLILAQIIAAYTLIVKKSNKIWTEGSATFYYFAIISCISLVSQIYNVGGEFRDFILVINILYFPLIYLMNSSVASLIFVISNAIYGLTFYEWIREVNYPYFYWIGLLVTIPIYVKLLKDKDSTIFFKLHNIFLVLTFLFILGTPGMHYFHNKVIHIINFLGIILLIRNRNILGRKFDDNIFKLVGFYGTIIFLIFFSFENQWNGFTKSWVFENLFKPYDIVLTIGLLSIALYLFVDKIKQNKLKKIHPIYFVFLLFNLIFLIGIQVPIIGMIIINVVLILIGLYEVLFGLRNNLISKLNIGLLIITVVVYSRFSDESISILLKGIVFILVGIGFLVANIALLRRRKLHAN